MNALPNRQPAGTTSSLVVRNLKKRYGSRTVVKDVSLDVKSGEVVGLLGPNGAGKTTSFYMIVGLVPLDAGDISLNGSPISLMPIHKRASLGLSYLPQEASVFRKLTVEQNVRAVLELQHDENGKRLSKDAIGARTEALLEELQIAHLRENPALSLSGGERRRVEIARALASNPSFILLDEPFAGVDPIAVLEIQKIVKFLKQRNIGVLITDHNVRETLGICDHAYIISDGSVLASGAPKEIIETKACGASTSASTSACRQSGTRSRGRPFRGAIRAASPPARLAPRVRVPRAKRHPECLNAPPSWQTSGMTPFLP